MKKLVVLITFSIILIQTGFTQTSWRQELSKQIPELGHRNWIIVADAAYPMQVKSGIQTLVTDEDQLDVVKEVLRQVKNATHLSPDIFLDKELDFVPEKEVSGLKKYKKDLDKLLEDEKVSKMMHEQLIAEIEEAGQNFRVLVLKTKATMPYTSVFIRLDCGYWSTEQEQELRENMK